MIANRQPAPAQAHALGTATHRSPPSRSVGSAALRVFGFLGSLLAALIGLGWLGLLVQPAPFPATLTAPAPPATVPLPAGLPAPVARYYRLTYGETVPVIETAVLTGRGTMRPFAGLTFPVRFRFIHDVGRGFRAYFELTAFGLPLMRVDEHYVAGRFRQAGTPAGVVDSNLQLEQGAATRLWAEYLAFFPAALLTTPGARWEPLDDTTAVLAVPFGDQTERFVVRFDPATGDLRHWEVMRYKTADATARTLWIDGMWLDDGRPWAQWNIENRVFNVPVDIALATTGP